MFVFSVRLKVFQPIDRLQGQLYVRFSEKINNWTET